MKILITTPTYPPEIGGPALYSSSLEEELENRGNKVRLVKLSLGLPSFFRHALLGSRLALAAMYSRVIFSLDHFSVGFPAALVSKFFGKKFFVRVGGDFLWEHYVNRTMHKITIKEFYQSIPKLNTKEKFIFWAAKFTLRQAYRVVFSTSWQRDIFLTPYNLKPHRTVVIENYFPLKQTLGVELPKREFVWAGRMVFLKNLDALLVSFKRFVDENDGKWKLRLIGEGPERQNLESRILNLGLKNNVILENTVSKDELKNIMNGVWATVLPSLSEVSPNFLIESVSLGTPFIATKESGYAERFLDGGIMIDPKNQEDIYNAFIAMSKKVTRDSYVNNLAKTSNKEQSWSNMTEEYLDIFI